METKQGQGLGRSTSGGGQRGESDGSSEAFGLSEMLNKHRKPPTRRKAKGVGEKARPRTSFSFFSRRMLLSSLRRAAQFRSTPAGKSCFTPVPNKTLFGSNIPVYPTRRELRSNHLPCMCEKRRQTVRTMKQNQTTAGNPRPRGRPKNAGDGLHPEAGRGRAEEPTIPER